MSQHAHDNSIQDVADFVLSGGVGASESENEADMEAPNLGGGGGKVGVRLTEVGPRAELSLIADGFETAEQ